MELKKKKDGRGNEKREEMKAIKFPTCKNDQNEPKIQMKVDV